MNAKVSGKRLGRWAPFLALVVASGCVTVGTKVDDEQLKQIVVGKTTEAEVVKLLGNPGGYSEQPDGSRVLTWVQSSIPIGPFSGGTTSQGVVIIFRNGVVSRIGKSASGNGGRYAPPAN